MPVVIQCPCGRSLKLRDDLQGKRIRCPECRNALDVPRGNAGRTTRPKPKPRPRDEAPRASRQRRTSRPSSRRKSHVSQKPGLPKWIVVVSGSALALIAAFFLVPWDTVFTTKVAPESVENSEPVDENSLVDNQAVTSIAESRPASSNVGPSLSNSPDGTSRSIQLDVPVQVSEYCSVSMPGQPDTQGGTSSTPFGPVTAKLLMYDTGSVLFTAAHTNYSDGFVEQAVARLGGDRTKLLEQAAVAAKSSRFGSQVVSESILSITNGHQLDMTFTFQPRGAEYGGTSVTRAFLHGNQMHIIGFQISEQECLENPGVIDRLKNQFLATVKLNVPLQPTNPATPSTTTASNPLLADTTNAAGMSGAQDNAPPTTGQVSTGTTTAQARASSGTLVKSTPSFPFPTSAISETGASNYTQTVPVSDNFTLRFPAAVKSLSSQLPNSSAKFGLHECKTTEAKYQTHYMDLGRTLGGMKPDHRYLSNFFERYEPSDELFTLTEQSFSNTEGITRHDRTFTVTGTNKIVAISRLYLVNNEIYGVGFRLTGDTPAKQADLPERIARDFFGSVSITSTAGSNSTAPFTPTSAASNEIPITSKPSTFTPAMSSRESKSSPTLPGTGTDSSASVSSDNGVVWGRTDKIFPLPKQHNSTVSYSGSPAKAVCIEERIWDITTAQEVGQISLPDASRCFIVTNSDCSYAAAIIRTTSWELTEIRIFAMNGTQSQPISIPIKGAPRVEKAFFGGANRLFVHLQSSDEIRVWNAENGTEFKPLEIETTGTVATAIGHGGKYMAAGDWEGVQVIDTSSSRIVATMSNPAADEGMRFPHTEAIAFSPDMKELAGFMDGDRLVVWSNRGKVLIDHQLPPTEGLSEESVQWLPNGKGWFVRNELLVLREGLINAWQVEYPSFFKMVPGHVLDDNHILLATGGFSNGQLSAHEIPWDQINAAIEAVNPEKNALVFPGQGVSLDIQVGTVRFSNPQQTKSAIAKSLTERLSKSQLSVGENQPVILEVVYSEAAGKQITVRQLSLLAGNGTQTQLPNTDITCELKMKDSKSGDTIWSTEVTSNAGILIDAKTVDEAALRADAFKSLLLKIQRVRIPTRVANDPDQQLPVITKIAE